MDIVKITIKIIIIILILFFVIYLLYDTAKLFYIKPNSTTENFVDVPNLDNKENKSWKIDDKCQYSVVKAYKDVLEKHHIKKSDNDKWSLYIPCTYNEISEELVIANKNIKKNNANDIDKRIFVVNNCDEITAKDSLWKNLLQYYGRNNAITMMPTTYILYDNKDIDLFKKEFKKENIYIMKKNIQRQEGLLITQDQDAIINGYKKNGYVIAQELLQDPYTIKGRKIYLLIVCIDGKIGGYVYNNGFMYYTKTKFEKGSTSSDSNITTGYIDRQVYEENPLTLKDFKTYLDSDRIISFHELNVISDNKIISEYVFDNIYNLMRKMITSLELKICNKVDLKNNVQFQIFGVDVSLSDKLIPQIMEVNKGPDLGYKDDRDKEVKIGVVEDAFKILKVINDDGINGYVSIF